MGSYKHPRLFDPTLSNTIRSTFYEVMAEIDGPDVLEKKSLKADILQHLLDLALGDTPPDEWKAKVLSSLSLR